jgi:CBS domain containing-hemolysin-like protein
MSSAPVYFILLFLVAASALLSAVETAFFSLKPFELEKLRARGGGLAEALGRMLENPRRLLGAVLLGDALVNLPLIILCLWLLRRWAGGVLSFAGLALVVFALVVFACDLVPKLVGLAKPVRVSRLGVRGLRLLLTWMDPLSRRMQSWGEAVADRLMPQGTQHILGEEELETLVEVSAEQGALHETESEIIQDIIKLGDKTARDCMTPRLDAFMIPDDLPQEELLRLVRDRRKKLVPVYGETPDDILGVLDVQAFLLSPGDHYTERLGPPSFVSETMKATQLLRSFLTHPQGLAIVVDEHGGVEGVVTMDDLVEEIISDAVPQAERSLYIEALGQGEVLASGRARLDDLGELLGVEWREEGIDTIGGLIFNRLGVLPRTGARVELDGAVAVVRRTSHKRVEEVLLRVNGESASGGADTGKPGEGGAA